MVGNPRYGRLGTAMLPVKAIDTLQPLYGLTGVVLLFGYLAAGRIGIVRLIAEAIGVKIVIDLAFHLWSLRVYRRWIGASPGTRLLPAILAALLEPFSFQLLRHSGAALGWIAFLRGTRSWGVQERLGGGTAEPSKASGS